jgi:hypothetical protein
MADETTPENNVETPAAETHPPETVTLTTAQLDARLKRAAASASSEFVSSLGFKSKDELSELIKAHRESTAAQQSEAERALARANEASAAANAANEALLAERRQRVVMEAALKAGIPGERIGAVTRLVDHGSLTYADGAFTGADEAVAQLVAENAWITAGASRPVGTGANGGAQGNGNAATGLTAEQQHFAKLTGVSPERYAAAAQGGAGEANREYVAGSLEAQAKAYRGN